MALSDFYTNNKFDIGDTIQSQYSASPCIIALINAFWECLKPGADIELIYNKMVNPDTAEGVGLDVWGRIVGAGREIAGVLDTTEKYLGFDSQYYTNTRNESFNNAPFYAEWRKTVKLSDAEYRSFIFVKAMINIGISSLADINRVLKIIIPHGAFVVHSGTMELRLVLTEDIRPVDFSAFLQLPWLPTGVGLKFYQIYHPAFGFNGSELQNFNNGTFAMTIPLENI